MSEPKARFRPKMFPPPEFPPRKLPLFARMPLAVFPPILGLLGLVLALRAALTWADLPLGFADLLAGLVLPLWLFALVGLGVKIIRRPAVLAEDLRVIPSRSGLAAATMGALAGALILQPIWGQAAWLLLGFGLIAHLAVAAMVVRALILSPVVARRPEPGWHLVFVGFILGGLFLAREGQGDAAEVVFWVTLPIALGIWAADLYALARKGRAAPLRPALAIHLSPLCYFSMVAAALDYPDLAYVFAVFTLGALAALVLSLGWGMQAGVSPMWGAYTFPLTAASAALLNAGLGGVAWMAPIGAILALVALIAVPMIAWVILKAWPGGKLAARTNAQTA